MEEKVKPKSSLKHRLAPYEAYLWLLPSILMIVIFIAGPVIETFQVAFSDVSKAGLIKGFGGLSNFQYLFKQSAFGRVMLNTLIWTVVVVGVSTVLSLVMAMVLNVNFKGRKFVRTALLFPWATSLMITSCAWKYILDYQYGALNALLLKLGWIKTNINFLGNADSAFKWLMVVGVIVTVPFMTFTLLAGLQSISTDYYEAAAIDGANFWDKLFRITLPLLKPALNVSTVLNVIYVFNSFVIVNTITNGAPANQTDTIMTYIYTLAFKNYKYGPSAALSVIGFAILLVFSIIYMKLMMKEDDAK